MRETYAGGIVVTDQLHVIIVSPRESVVVHQAWELKIVTAGCGVGNDTGKEVVVMVSVTSIVCPRAFVVGMISISLQIVVMVPVAVIREVVEVHVAVELSKTSEI